MISHLDSKKNISSTLFQAPTAQKICSLSHIQSSDKKLDVALVKTLLQAVIDHDIQQVKNILDDTPELLLVDPLSEGITEIESQKTWQKFITEKPFIMALKLKRLDMINVLLPYIEKLTQQRKIDIQSQWNAALPALKTDMEKLKKRYYEEYLQQLIQIICVDKDANTRLDRDEKYKFNLDAGSRGLNSDPKMNNKTKLALQTFRETLLPNKAIAINDYFDIEQFLIAAHEAYTRHFLDFETYDQRDFYSLCVVGFIQSLIAPEIADMYCRDFRHIFNGTKMVDKNQADYTLMNDDRSFYRKTRNSDTGLGYTFFVTETPYYSPLSVRMDRYDSGFLKFKQYVTQKNQQITKLCEKGLAASSHHLIERAAPYPSK